MVTKICSKCNIQKPLDAFHNKAGGKYGKTKICKLCRKELDKKTYCTSEYRKHHREYEKQWRDSHPKQNKTIHQNWYCNNHDEIIKRNHTVYSKQIKTRAILWNAYESGQIKKPSKCEICAEKTAVLHAHHDDYDKPLDIIWVCPKCHGKLHIKNQ